MALLPAALLSGVACAPGVRVRGSVAEVGSSCTAAAPVPLPEARVAIHCPDRHQPLVEMTTDARGRFELRRGGILSKACWIRISKPGHTEAIYPLGPLCAVEGTVLEGCHGFSVQAELERPTPPPSAQADAERVDGDGASN